MQDETKEEFIENFMKNDYMGLTRRGHHLLWGYSHGWFRWAPDWFKSSIVTIWNFVSCRLFGHDIYGPIDDEFGHMPKTCVACCKIWEQE